MRTPILLAGLLLIAGLAPVPAWAADGSRVTHESFSGTLTGGGLGLHIAKTVTWRGVHDVAVTAGVTGVQATLTGTDDTAGGDFWVAIVGPDRETIAQSPDVTTAPVSTGISWPEIASRGFGTYSAVVECGLCGTFQYQLDVALTWASQGANLTVDDQRLLVVSEKATTTGFAITNTGGGPQQFTLAAPDLAKNWRLQVPTLPPLASHDAFRGEVSLAPKFAIKPGTRIAFDLVVRDATGAERARVPMEAAYTQEIAGLQARSNVVIADIEAINPYHQEFRGPGSTVEHPAWYVDHYPADAKPLPLTLDAATYDEALARDHDLWANLTPDTLYYVPGTRIIGFICIGGCGVPALDTGGHGTGTASLAAGATLGQDPDALIVSVAGDFFRGARWAARQPWIDVITMSLGAYVGTCTLGETCSPLVGAGTGNPYVPFSIPFAQRLAYESGKRFFTGSSQGWGAYTAAGGVSGPCPYMWAGDFTGSPWTYAVETYWPWTELPWRTSCFPPEVVAQGWDLLAASAFSLNGTNEFGHTSGATPIAAGAYARVLHEARRAVHSPQEGATRVSGPVPGVSARLEDFVVGTGTKRTSLGPGSDGILLLSEVEHVYQHGLEQVDTVTSYQRHGTDPRWSSDASVVPTGEEFASEGFGLVTATSRALSGQVARGETPEPVRPDDDALYAAHFAARLAFWEPQMQEEVWVF